MTSLNILSGGAAQGLVGSLAAKFREQTGLDIGGDFGAVGAMADKLRAGTPADILILTSALIATLAKEGLADAASVKDVGRVETALAVRETDPLVSALDAESLRKVLLAADAIDKLVDASVDKLVYSSTAALFGKPRLHPATGL